MKKMGFKMNDAGGDPQLRVTNDELPFANRAEPRFL